MPKQRANRAPSPETESSTRDVAGKDLPPGDSTRLRPDRLPPPAAGNGIGADDDAAERAGTDSRRRGWYWHWNGIVTQYAPLIGLKGVGLLNSYTVWTDRRDQSPTRGYAFPSQQSEAAFYGEDRAELITINKILVALDLVEIRKEMVQRTDPQGRKWKVPHNLYRVKDRPDGLELRTADVLRVAELASRDAAVFRYVKRIFSSRFTPIDRDNAWHNILIDVAGDPVWRELTAKTARIEARASARSRAGHKSRSKQDPDADETHAIGAEMTTGHSDDEVLVQAEHPGVGSVNNQTSVEQINHGPGVTKRDVASSNNGSEPAVEQLNTGSQGGDASSAEETNNGQESVVAPSNATYYQEISTTTTTNGTDFNGHRHRTTSPDPDPGGDLERPGQEAAAGVSGPHRLDDDSAVVQTTDRSGDDRDGGKATQRRLADPAAGGPLVGPGPLVVSLFEAANNRGATPLERTLLGELERDATAPAGRCGETGADWVCAALREAVSSGSAFVAPKRIREIINRWAATGTRPGVEQAPALEVVDGETDQQPVIRLPRGRSAAKVWFQVLKELEGVLDPSTHQRLFDASRISGYRAGVIEIEVQPGVESKLSTEYRPLLQRHLERHIGRDVTVRFVAGQTVERNQPEPGPEPVVISKADAEQGRQLWRAVLHEMSPEVSADDLARLGSALPLGQDADGRIVVGASTSLATRLIEGRCRAPLESAILAVLGDPATIRVAAAGTWLVAEGEAE